MGQGNATTGTVTATFASAPQNGAIIVSHYSGADPSAPLGMTVSGNTNGLDDGTCAG